MLRCSMPDDLNLNILRRLLRHCAPRAAATVVSVMKEQDSSQTVIEVHGFTQRAAWHCRDKAAHRVVATDGAHHCREALQGAWQLGRLIRSISQLGRITERHARFATLLSKLPYQHLTLNLALLHQNAVPTMLAKIEEMQRGGMRASRHAAIHGGPRGLARPADNDSARSGSARGGWPGESQPAVSNRSKPPSEEQQPKKNILRRLRTGRVHDNRKPHAHGRLCPVHRGVCSPAATFCLVEAGTVECLLGVLESNENSHVVEAALGALCTLMDDGVDVVGGVAVLTEHDAPRHVLRLVRQHRNDEQGSGAVLRRCFWALESFLENGGDRCVREVTSDRALPSALVGAFHKGDTATKQVAESVLRSLHRMPDYSATYVSVEL
ncbi:hypothetical protein ZWY2020_014023 [Hordeum vulgare]|nr:hypothetical protein ZWY2020_014023 [Hordeum vulgare]